MIHLHFLIVKHLFLGASAFALATADILYNMRAKGHFAKLSIFGDDLAEKGDKMEGGYGKYRLTPCRDDVHIVSTITVNIGLRHRN